MRRRLLLLCGLALLSFAAVCSSLVHGQASQDFVITDATPPTTTTAAAPTVTLVTAAPATGDASSTDAANAAGYGGGSYGDDQQSIPLYKAGGLRRSRFDRSGFTLFELNQINELNLENLYSHGNGVPSLLAQGDSNDGETDSKPTNSGLGVIGAPTTGNFGGGPNQIGIVSTGGATDVTGTATTAGVNTAGYNSGYSNSAAGNKGYMTPAQKGNATIILRQRFLGLSNLEQKLGLPPDAVIATGRYQVLEASNDFERIAIYRKSITSRTLPEEERKKDKFGPCKFDEHGMPAAGPGNFPYGGPLGGYLNGYSSSSASSGYGSSSSSSSAYGFGGYDAQYSGCSAYGCGSGGDCDYNGYEDEYSGGYGEGGDYGNNGGYGNSDYGRSGANIDLDYTSAAANGKDPFNQKGDVRRLLIGALPYTAIWSGFSGPCEEFPSGSGPMVHYDQTAGRFIIAHVTRPKPDKKYYSAADKESYKAQDIRVCVAVSIDEDAAGLYYRYSFNMRNKNLLLHPKLAVWPASNSYFITFDSKDNNQWNAETEENIDLLGPPFNGVVILALDRANMLQGQLADARWGQLKNDGYNTYHGCLAGDQDGFNISPYLDELIVCLDPSTVGFQNELDVFAFRADWADAGFSLLGPSHVRVPKYRKACDEYTGCVPQKGTTNKLSAGGNGLNFRAAYRSFFGFDPFTNRGAQNYAPSNNNDNKGKDDGHGAGPAGGANSGGYGSGGYGSDGYGGASGGYSSGAGAGGNNYPGSGASGGGGYSSGGGGYSGGGGGHGGGYSSGGASTVNSPSGPISAGNVNGPNCAYPGRYGYSTESYSHKGRSGSTSIDRTAFINPLQDSLCTNGDVSFGRTFNPNMYGSDYSDNYSAGKGVGGAQVEAGGYGASKYGGVESDYVTLSHSVYADSSYTVVWTRWYVLRRVRNTLQLALYGTIVPGKGRGDKSHEGSYASSWDPKVDEYPMSGGYSDSSSMLSAFYASVAMDASGNLGAGYSVSGRSIFPQIRFASLAAPYSIVRPFRLRSDEHSKPGAPGAAGGNDNGHGGSGGGYNTGAAGSSNNNNYDYPSKNPNSFQTPTGLGFGGNTPPSYPTYYPPGYSAAAASAAPAASAAAPDAFAAAAPAVSIPTPAGASKISTVESVSTAGVNAAGGSSGGYGSGGGGGGYSSGGSGYSSGGYSSGGGGYSSGGYSSGGYSNANDFVPNYSDVNSPNNFNYFVENEQRSGSFNPPTGGCGSAQFGDKNSCAVMRFFKNELILARSGGFQGPKPYTPPYYPMTGGSGAAPATTPAAAPSGAAPAATATTPAASTTGGPTYPQPSPSPRWGQFSTLVLDPNDCFFWYVNSIVPRPTYGEVFYASLIFGLQSVSCQAEAVMDVGAGKWGAGGDYKSDGSYANMDSYNNLGNVNIPFNNFGQRPEQSGIFANYGSGSSYSSSGGSYSSGGDSSHGGPLGSGPGAGAGVGGNYGPGAAGGSGGPLDHGISGPTTGAGNSGGGYNNGGYGGGGSGSYGSGSETSSNGFSLGGGNAYNGFSSDPLNVGNGGGPVQAGGGLLGNAGGNSCYDSKGLFVKGCGGKPGEFGNPNPYTGATSNPFGTSNNNAAESNKPGPPGAGAGAGPIKNGPAGGGAPY